MTKQLDETTITNELKGASAFFTHPQVTVRETVVSDDKPTERSNGRTANRSHDRSDDRSASRSERTTVRASGNARTARSTPTESTELHSVMDEINGAVVAPLRPTERYAFEIFSDQKRKINRIRFLYEEKTGRQLHASRMLREAIEPYLNELEEQLSRL